MKEIKLPDGVTEISESILQYCDSPETVKLPGNVKSIGMMAFFWDKNLTNIELPDSVTSIGERAFIGCAKMNPVNLKNVTQIGDYAFRGCESMNPISIPDRLESMGEFAFADCTGWTEDVNGNKNIVIPRSLDKISVSTFQGCSGLTEMTIPDSVAGIEDSAFKGCSNLQTLNIAVSDTTSSIPVKDLAVFEGCPSPRQVVFWNADGTEKLTGARLDRAKLTYLNAPDGNTDDDTWYGWSIDRPNTYAVTIHVNLDGNLWTDHNKTFALREDGDTEFVTDLAHVPNGTYSIFDITGGSVTTSSMARAVGTDTDVDVTVQDGNA